jgi:hypothetical protein
MTDIEVEDMIRRPQLVSVLKPIKERIDNVHYVDVDDLLLHEYNKILMRFDEYEQFLIKPDMSGYKLLDYSKDKALVSDISDEDLGVDDKICSNCRKKRDISKSIYSPSFVIHFCKYCLQAFDYPLGDIMDP